MKTVHIYEVRPYESGVGGLKLMKDGNECFCHKLMPMIVSRQNSLGQVMQTPVRLPCNTQCVHAQVWEKENKELVYITTCEGIRNEHHCKDMPAEAAEPQPTETKSNIIKLP